MQEIKKRGDLARQLCSAKDEEIKQLREKLHFQQRQPSPFSPHKQRRDSNPDILIEENSNPQILEPKDDQIGVSGNTSNENKNEGAVGSELTNPDQITEDEVIFCYPIIT